MQRLPSLSKASSLKQIATASIALGLFLPALSFAAATINVDYVEKSVVFLYTTDAAGQPSVALGTGFIVQVPVTSRPGQAYKILVTARHMVDPQWAGCPNLGSPKIFLHLNKKKIDPAKDATGTEDLDAMGEIAAAKTWFVSDDLEVDAALLILNGSVLDKYDVEGVRISDFPTPEETKGIKAGADIVSAGLLPGASGKKRNYPIFKFGNVSSIPGEPADAPRCGNQSSQSHFLKLWFVAANLAPGNSGSPIYFEPRLFPPSGPFYLVFSRFHSFLGMWQA